MPQQMAESKNHHHKAMSIYVGWGPEPTIMALYQIWKNYIPVYDALWSQLYQ